MHGNGSAESIAPPQCAACTKESARSAASIAASLGCKSDRTKRALQGKTLVEIADASAETMVKEWGAHEKDAWRIAAACAGDPRALQF